MQDFTNENIDLDRLPKYEEIPLNTPHPNYWKVIVLNLSLVLTLIFTVLTILAFFNEEFKPFRIYLFVAFSIIVILLFLLFKTSFKKRGYALREKDIVYKSGIIAETTTIIPLNRIQHVALDEGVFSRIYGLATLKIYTAGGQTGHLRIAGLLRQDAQVIKEALIRKIDLLA